MLIPDGWSGNGVKTLRRISYWISYVWRLVATDLSFSVFGAGALLASLIVFPVLRLIALVFFLGREWAHRRCQFSISIGFHLFIEFMRFFGVLTYEVRGAEKLRDLSGTLIVSNHPTLLDVVFIISMVPQTLCVVKKEAWTNPFLLGVMWGTGYIQNDEPMQLIDDCVQGMEAGNNLLIFPEATRTVRGKPMKLRRGAASIISTSLKPFVPITITCDPLTLTKADKWFMPAPQRMHYEIIVHDAYDPAPEIIDINQLSLSNRRINRILEKLFAAGLDLHG
ncbi:MAG: 1-acyl-sn-glycerol-3-phosphate acyltransferase [Rhodospirillales bacterium]|nr:1-acyl-sn-glycerol-3-phosphate acyltransferase [Rhodospirillales bacterium]